MIYSMSEILDALRHGLISSEEAKQYAKALFEYRLPRPKS